MVMILEKYGCTPNLCDTITRMYKYSMVKLVSGEFETTIEFKVSVKQGDSVAPVLFLLPRHQKRMDCQWINQSQILTQ